ncbi:MAG: tyrosine--tRNA ligase [Rhodobacteraceae bacterium]|nr:tyrosine--tRNA ligase [Paracoccaceae bacterium]
MTEFRSEFMQIMHTRGYLDDCSNAADLDRLLATGARTAYIGFDATADSLHVGSLIQIMMLKWLQESGHRPIVLMGGGTTRIGDPSFRADERPILDDRQITENIDGIRSIFARYLQFDGIPHAAIMANNDDWLRSLNYIGFLREIGRHFSVNRMLSFESVRSRLEREQSLSFLEFNYMILQAYDYLELHRRHACILQMGGSDQWGNILNGIDLVRRLTGEQVFALTSPLLTTADGRKMGKSAQGAVWLNANRLSPFDFWQYWRNVHDDDVARFLKLFTMLPVDECERLGRSGEINAAKIILANEITALAHGPKTATEIAKAAHDIFVQGTGSDAVPVCAIPAGAFLPEGLPLPRALVLAGLTPSGKEARRRLQEGGVRVNDHVVMDASHMLSCADIRAGCTLAVGKKRFARLAVDD